MDRVIVYPGALPQTVDVLNTGKFALVDQAYQNRSILGTNTVVSGLACTPTSPTPDLHVTIGVGSIYQMDPTDQTAFGDLGTDNNNIMKQGMLQAPVALTITPPSTGGFSQVYLVEAEIGDVDGGLTVLSYYNSANPASPYSGPANSGTSNFTTRTNPCIIALKAGIAATTGTQTTPAPDAGFIGLYAITVVNGATQVLSGNIVQLPSAPFFPTLPSVPTNVQNGSWVWCLDTGLVNALVITPINPQTTALVAGMGFRVKALVTNTGASTITINGSSTFGPIAIRRASGVALSANDIISGQIVELVYDGTNFQMVNYLGAAATTSTITNVFIPYIADSGTANALVGTYSPAITSGQQIAGLFLSIKLANNITGACTINVNGLGIKNVLLGDLGNPLFNVFLAGEVLLLVYDGTQYQVVNTSSATYRKPIANTTIFVNTGIGNDANDGVSNTVGHAMLTIQGGLNKAFSYAPSQFTITIVVEPGTYNEQVTWPSYAGPNVIIDGLVSTSVIVAASVSTCFFVQGPNTALIKNLTATCSGGLNNACFMAVSGATVTTSNTISLSSVAVFAAADGGTMWPGTHTFSGSCACLYFCLAGGTLNLSLVQHTFSTGIAVSLSSAYCISGGSIQVNSHATPFINPSFVSGIRFQATLNGVVNTNGQGVNYFPGTVAGANTLGGQYG